MLALLPVLARLKDQALAERGFLVAFLAASSTSKRTRKQVLDAAKGAGLELAAKTTDEAALRASLKV